MFEPCAKTLLIRLSSLGDVILATAALEPFRAQGHQCDWVVAQEYAELLRGHPAVRKIWTFERRSGLKGWLRLCSELEREGYSEILDLHGSLRTRILRLKLLGRYAREKAPTWRSSKKPRFQLYGYYWFKSLWPAPLKPVRAVVRFARASGGTGQERPNLTHLLRSPSEIEGYPGEPYLCLMPGSLWPGKKWPVERFVQVATGSRLLSVVLGSSEDQECRDLVSALEQAKLPVISGVGRWSLPEIATVLAGAESFVGNDTGLAHLAEAVGTGALVVFGPTVPGMGFGPWRPDSRAIGAKLGCRPCGKDGRFCYRIGDRYRCMRAVSAEEVLHELRSSPP